MARSTRQDRRLSRQQILLVVCLALVVGFLVDFGSLILKAHDLDVQAAAYEKDKAQLDRQNLDLQARLAYVRSDEWLRIAAAELLLWGDAGAKFLMPVEGNPAPKTP